MPPVVIGGAIAAAGIAAAGAVGAAALSSKAQKKAASKSAEVAQETSAENNALQREIYTQNQAYLAPYAGRGNEAGNAINALLGIAGTAPTGPVYTLPTPIAPVPVGTGVGPNGLGSDGLALTGSTPRFQAFAKKFLDNQINGGELTLADAPPWYHTLNGTTPTAAVPAGAIGATPVPTTGTAPAASPVSTYQNAFQNYLDSTGYQFQMDQGNKAINQGYAAKGSLQSGAALKALQTYGQDTAKGFFKDYLGLLANQQAVGLSGAGAIAGVGTGYANSVSANNNMAMQQQINAFGQRADATSGLWGTVGGAIGGIANAFGSSYRPTVGGTIGGIANAFGRP